MKNNNYGETKHNRTRSWKSVHAHESSTRNHSRKHNCDEVSSDVIRWVLLLHIGANPRIMLARNFASCHVARNTLVMLEANNVPNLRWPAISLDLNPIDHLLDLLKRKVRAQPMELNLREFTLVIHRMCAAIQHQYIHRHILSMSARCLVVDATPGGCTKYWNEIKYDVIWICSFCVKGVPVNPLI